NGEVDYFNQQWMTFTGLGFASIGEWDWTRLVHPDDAAESIRMWRSSVESGELFEITHRIRRADGAFHWHLSRARAMRGHEGRVAMWIGSSTEIHEQKDIEEN